MYWFLSKSWSHGSANGSDFGKLSRTYCLWACFRSISFSIFDGFIHVLCITMISSLEGWKIILSRCIIVNLLHWKSSQTPLWEWLNRGSVLVNEASSKHQWTFEPSPGEIASRHPEDFSFGLSWFLFQRISTQIA